MHRRIGLNATSRYFTFSLIITLALAFFRVTWQAPVSEAAPATNAAISASQWRQLPGPGRVNVRAFLGSGQYLFAASDAGSVFRSANNGENWMRVNNGLTPRIGEKVYSLAAIGTAIFAGT